MRIVIEGPDLSIIDFQEILKVFIQLPKFWVGGETQAGGGGGDLRASPPLYETLVVNNVHKIATTSQILS